MIEVLKYTFWHHAQSNLGASSGLSSQLTMCRYQGITFYVRENANGLESFVISSGERWGDKIGKKPSARRQVLELCAPPKHWQELAILVQQVDKLKRPVRANKRFTQQWCREQFDAHPTINP